MLHLFTVFSLLLSGLLFGGQAHSQSLADETLENAVARAEAILAGNTFVGSDGSKQAYGEMVHHGSMHWMMWDTVTADGNQEAKVVTFVEGEAGKAVLIIQGVDGGNVQNYRVGVSHSNNLLVLPLENADRDSDPFVSFLCRERTQSVCRLKETDPENEGRFKLTTYKQKVSE